MNPPAAGTATAPELTITPPGRWSAFRLGELWGHRELIYFLTKRELQVRYKQSFFGVAWAVLQPLALAFIFALIFGKFIRVGSEGVPFAVFAVAGIVPWLFLAQAITNSSVSLVNDANLISKVYFPRLAIPIAKSLSLVLDLAIALVVVVIVTIVYGVQIAATIYLVPLFLLLGLVTAFALGALFAAVNVKYRDVGLVVPVLVQLMLFLTPVFYPSTLVTGAWEYVYAINPMVSVIDGMRWALLAEYPYPGTATIAISVGSALLLLGAALAYFRRSERFFADVI